MNFLDVLGLILIITFVGGLAYLTTRLVGQVNVARFKNNNMKIIEVLNLGFQKYLYLVEVASEYIIISVSREGISMIDKVDTEKIKTVENKENSDFKSVLKDIIKRDK